MVSARLESTRNPELRAYAGIGLGDCLRTLVTAAKARGELSEDTAVAPGVEMLHAMLLGVVFYAGFVDDAADSMRHVGRHAERRRGAAIDWRPYG